jgi:hypothetical protein
MPPVTIPWPTSALPGRRPGDGQGDLVNAYAVKIGDLVEIRRTPGVVGVFTLADTSDRVPRGMHALPHKLYHVWDEQIRAWDGFADTLAGALPGIDRVTMAHNMRDPVPQLVVVTDLGAYLVDTSADTITVFPDPDGNLGTVNSVEYFSGYFVFTRASGYFAVSDLQSAVIPDDSFGKTEAKADTLLRAKAMQSVVLLMSTSSIEAWVDVATSPMPFARQISLDIGLLGRWAVAGGSNEWERGVFFVASDFTVRQMDGLVPKIISNDAVATDIYECRETPDDIVMQCHTFEQQAVISITCQHTDAHHSWTWEYNVSSGAWHRRDSYGLDYWRYTNATVFQNRWLVQDLYDGEVLEVRQEVFDEAGERMRFRCESGPIKGFPANVRIPSIDIDCIVALGKNQVPSPFETNPAMMISWSHDGGANWSNPVARSFGRIGRFGQKVSVHNLGRSTHHGCRIRVDVVDPVAATILGGVSVGPKPSRPRAAGK